MGPDQYIRLSQLNDQIQDTINARFKGQTYWVVADITNHSFKADKKIHYFELVEKAETGSTITAKILGKSWGAGALKILDFEITTGQRFTNNLHVLVQLSVDYHPLYGLSVNLLDIDSNFMLGILEQQRNATLARLVKENDFIEKEGEGYATFNSRLKLPAVIQRIAVISSSSSAGNEDFRHTMLYIRVSTDEQAEKGYSQRNQEEVLRKYCSINYIEVRNVIYEDHSAKTFNRPQWNKLLLNLKKQKNTTDLVLFTKWDRFSRNAGDAYQMISLLRKLGVEPQAIEQPLDLAIPENKMMLAFYLAAPEVENDRRALNTFHGMRRAKKEGRYMGIAPFGYANKSKEDGSKYIALVEPAASVMRWIFEELAKGIFNTEQIYHMACRRGFKRTKNNMWGLIRNPVYCGKIFIPKYKDEESKFVTGQHEPLISEGLFYNVQDILDGKSRLYRPKIKTVVDFPLRGFFICPKCQKKLQGSKCKGRHKYYHYYHCEAQCKFRINSEIANELFIEDLNKYQPIAEVKKLYSSILYETHRDLANNAGEQKRRLVEQIKDYELRLSNARDLLLTSKIEADDYKLMKDDYGARIANLERELSTVTKDKHSIEELLIKGVDNLIKLSDSYLKRDLSDARSLIGLVYPENFTIHENKVQTARVNKIVESIYLINKQLKAKKNGTKDDFYLLSREVTSTGFKPVTF